MSPTKAGAPAERIAKRIARSGLCSRREAERMIAQGRVTLEGQVLTSPALDVEPEQRVSVDGIPLEEPNAARLWRYHKPKGLVTTHRDPQGRPTVFAALPPSLGRVISIGRLDLASEGLLLLTNDGALARRLELPATGWVRRYRVRLHGVPAAQDLARLKAGLLVEGMRYGPIEARIDRVQGANAWLTVALREGKNRELRRVFKALGYEVARLIRIAYGPFHLGALEPGEIAPVPRKVLAEQVGGGVELAPKAHAHRRR